MRRPDLVDVWIYRAVPDGARILLLRRAPGRILPGLWQGVSGRVEPGESIVRAARRELCEETAFGRESIEGFYSLDYVAEFLWGPSDALMSSAYFAARVGAAAEPSLSLEHDAAEWVTVGDALARTIWPAYREAIVRIRDNLLDRERAHWFEVGEADGDNGGPSG